MADVVDDDIEYSVELTNITGVMDKVPVLSDDPHIHALLPKVLEAKVFLEWLERIEKDPLLFVKNVLVQSVDMFGPRVGFIKFKAAAQLNVGGEEGVFDVPGIVFMRGGAVGVMVILECEGKEYTILTYQARVPVGIHNLPEIPAGMLDGSGNFKGVAAEEIAEECNIVISENELIDLTAMAYGDKWQGILPSAGGCDEFIRLYMFRRVVDTEVLHELEGRLTGLRQEGERIKLHIVPLEDVWKMTPDVKALSCLALYDRLSLEGKIEWPHRTGPYLAELQPNPNPAKKHPSVTEDDAAGAGAGAGGDAGGDVDGGTLLSEDGLAQLAAINEAEAAATAAAAAGEPTGAVGSLIQTYGSGGSGSASRAGSDMAAKSAASSQNLAHSVRAKLTLMVGILLHRAGEGFLQTGRSNLLLLLPTVRRNRPERVGVDPGSLHGILDG